MTALAMFLMYWMVTVGGRRDITACRMRAKMSFGATQAFQFLATLAAQLQCGRVGEGAGGDDRDGTTVSSSSLPWPATL